MGKTDSLEVRVARIEARDARVDADRAWNNSFVRHAVITLATYLAMALYLLIIKVPNPLLTAIVPAGAYVLSVLTLRPLKKWWLGLRYPEQKR